jgi:hypothetical protein
VVAGVEVEAFCKDHFASILNIAPYFKKQPSLTAVAIPNSAVAIRRASSFASSLI